ncbi:MAG TPA: hypothetical protein VFO77_03140, partial [Actinoplanes sp.]|nr:hypothetical protein [Actinoplanes sp.]
TRTAVTATNSLDRDAVYEFAALQTGELFRVYVGNAWRQLAPGETSELEFAYESLAGDPVHGDMFDRYAEALTRHPSDVALTSWLEPSSDTECPTSRPWFGAGVRLIAGRKCWVRDARWHGEVVQATFEGSVNGTPTPVWGGTAYLSAWPAERPDEQFTADAQIHNDGTAYLLLPQELIRALLDGAEVTCLVARKGDHLFAETVSELITLR